MYTVKRQSMHERCVCRKKTGKSSGPPARARIGREDGMELKERAAKCVEALETEYPLAVCSLDATDAFQLLVATRLSAQCTDARVNLVTPELFAKYPTPAALAAADVGDVERIIHSCGFFRQKAKDIVATAERIHREFCDRVPDTIEVLTTLPGVGRKTANLIVGDVYGKPAVVADTHLIRITNLLGLVHTKDPVKVERELRDLLDPAKSNDFCHRCVMHGRAVCIAGRPKCAQCSMKEWCENKKVES